VQIQELQGNWNEFGKLDPLWAILTEPGKEGNKWGIDDFFKTGTREIDELIGFVRSIGLSPQAGEALDFGCGVGRLTQALCAHFDSATGVDIAPSMLELARQYNRQGDRCKYVLNESDNLQIFSANTFAFIYSNYVLQHMRPEYSLRYIQEFVRVLQPGGTLVFQLPSQVKGIKQRLKAAMPPEVIKSYRRLSGSGLPDGPVMETHTVPRHRVDRILIASGARVVHVRENPDHDARWRSQLYYVTK
jgi:SAM-dependent methyltransferase